MWRSAAGIGLARVLVASDVLQRGKRGAQTTQAEPARTLSLNRIIWMAGSRAVPQNGHITWNQGPTTSEFGKHRGNKFSEVLADDPDYLAWAEGQEAKRSVVFFTVNRSVVFWGGPLSLPACLVDDIEAQRDP